MDQLINSTKPGGKVSKSALHLRKALDVQKSKKGYFNDEPDAWDDLVKDIEDQDDIICLYRKDSDSNMRKADDWKKFLKSVSNGYAVHLALDKGKKYVICLKKISVPDADDATEPTTQEVSLEVTSEKPDLEEAFTEPGEETDNLETTSKDSLVETTEMDEIGESEEKSEPKKKLPETRKSRYGPSADDIRDSEDDDDGEEECSEEYDSDEDNEGEEDEDLVDAEDDNNINPNRQVEEAIAKAMEDDPKKFKHQQCNKPIIVVMQNPYGPNSIYSIPQISKNPLPSFANQLPKLTSPIMQPNYNPWNQSKFRFPYGEILNKYPKFNYPKHAHHPRHYRPRYLPRYKFPQNHRHVLGFSGLRPIPGGHKSHRIPELKNSQTLQPREFKPLTQSMVHYSKPPGFEFQTRKSSKEVFGNPEDILEPGQNLTPPTNLGPNKGGRPNPFSMNKLARPLVSIGRNYPNKGGRYTPLFINQSPCLPSSNGKSPFNPQGQKCIPNPLWKPQIGNSRNPRVLMSSWYNRPWFNNLPTPNRQIIPNQGILPNQEILSNPQILPDQPSLPDQSILLKALQLPNRPLLPNQLIFPKRPKLPIRVLLPGQTMFPNQLIFPNQPSFPNQQIPSDQPNFSAKSLLPDQLIFPNQPKLPIKVLIPSQSMFPNQQILPDQQSVPNQPSFPNQQIPFDQPNFSAKSLLPYQLIFPNQPKLPIKVLIPSQSMFPNQQSFPNQPSFPNQQIPSDQPNFSAKSLLPYQLIFPNQPKLPIKVLIPSQTMFPNQQILPDQQSFPNQPIFPDQQSFPNQQILPKQSIFPNPETSIASSNSCNCPSLCDKPIELKITIEGNVDKPVKIGILSQPGTWVNIVGNNNEENSRRMLEGNEDSNEETEGEDEDVANEEMDETDDSQSVTEDFTGELIENPVKADKKKEAGGAEKHKNVEDQKKDTDNKNQEENKGDEKAEEVEGRALLEITTVPDVKPTETTEITSPAV